MYKIQIKIEETNINGLITTFPDNKIGMFCTLSQHTIEDDANSQLLLYSIMFPDSIIQIVIE